MRAGHVGHGGGHARALPAGGSATLPALGFLCRPTGQPTGQARPRVGRGPPAVIGK